MTTRNKIVDECIAAIQDASYLCKQMGLPHDGNVTAQSCVVLRALKDKVSLSDVEEIIQNSALAQYNIEVKIK